MLIFLGVALAFMFLGYVIKYIPIKEEVVFNIGDRVGVYLVGSIYPEESVILDIQSNLYYVRTYPLVYHIWVTRDGLVKKKRIYLGGE